MCVLYYFHVCLWEMIIIFVIVFTATNICSFGVWLEFFRFRCNLILSMLIMMNMNLIYLTELFAYSACLWPIENRRKCVSFVGNEKICERKILEFNVWCVEIGSRKKNHANLMYYISTPVTSHKSSHQTHILWYFHMRNLKHFIFWFKTDSSPFFLAALRFLAISHWCPFCT